LLVVPPGTSFIQPDGTKQCKDCIPPLGLGYLAAQLSMLGDYEVRVYNMVVEDFYQERFVSSNTVLYGANYDQYRKVLEEYRPDLVGISCLLSSRANAGLNLCKITKEFDNEIFTVLGGHHATGIPRHVFQGYTDYVVLGEADHSFPQLVTTLSYRGDISQVAGIVYERNGELVVQERIDFVKDLNSLPFPEWDIVGLEKYWKGMLTMGITPKSNRYAVMCTSRGCPHVCDYCAVPSHTGIRNYRHRELGNVISEIEWLVDKYGIKEVQFLDDNFFVGKNRLKKLCKLLISKFPDMNFAVPTGTDLGNIDYELIDLLKEAGFYHMELGVETGNLDIQGKYVDKRIDLQDLKNKVQYMKKVGLETRGLFMLGFPYETREQIQDTVNLATSLDLDWIQLMMVTPLPGAPLYTYCLENDLLYDDYDVTRSRYSSTFIKNPYISREELESIRRNVWKDYMSKRINVDEYDNRGWSKDFVESQASNKGAIK